MLWRKKACKSDNFLSGEVIFTNIMTKVSLASNMIIKITFANPVVLWYR